MKNIIYFFLSVCSFVLMSAGCRKHKNNLETELAKLPPATQAGANTFGCLVNGKAWTPKGWDGRQPNFFVIVDPGYFGNLHIRTYRYIDNKRESLSIFCYDIANSRTYVINGATRLFINYRSEVSNCYFLQDSINYVSGFLKISRYDLQSGIVSGEFKCMLFDKSIACDTIKITHGRFDYKL